MELYDILYLNASRFDSLASQRFEGLTQLRKVNETVTKSNSGELVEPVLANKNTSSSVEHVGQSRDVLTLDDSFRLFLQRTKDDVVDLSAEASDEVLRRASDALESGQMVLATGLMVYEDTQWILGRMGSFYSFKDLTVTDVAERAELEAQRNTLAPMSNLFDAILGGAIDCSVYSGNPDDPVQIRALLNRACLRNTSELFLETFGRCTAVKFSILGFVTRIGVERASPGTERDGDFRDYLRIAHEAIISGAQAVEGKGNPPVTISPIAVFRSISAGKREPAMELLNKESPRLSSRSLGPPMPPSCP